MGTYGLFRFFKVKSPSVMKPTMQEEKKLKPLLTAPHRTLSSLPSQKQEKINRPLEFSEILKQLQELPVHHQTERTSLFLMLGELAPKSKEARTMIQGIVSQELLKPEEEKISLDIKAVDLHHDTRFHLKQDGLYLSNASTKLAALDTLRTIGDKESIQKLIEIAKDSSQPLYLRRAADDAILSFLDPREAEKIRASSK